jgi:hypothetical protein
MKKLAALLVVPALICALAGASFGEEGAPSPERKWYGWQTLAADAASVGVLVAGSATEIVPLAFVGFGGYLAGPPLIHRAHKHSGRATASLLLRIGLPLAGAAVGAAVADCSEDAFLCPLGEMVIGYGIGAAAAVLVDASMAWDTAATAHIAPPSPPPSSNRRTSISFTSAGIAPTSNGARLVVGGTF